MDKNLESLKNKIIELCANKSFIHNKWFVQWHLQIVEKLAEDMLKIYPEADKNTVTAMCWMHDYGKIINFDNQYDDVFREQGGSMMRELGFEDEFVAKIIKNIKTLDSKVNLWSANIETQIVSSADGCSHLVGPFINLYWYENPEKSYEDIMTENVRKQTSDWDEKVVIYEARQSYEHIHSLLLNKARGKILSIEKQS